MIGKSVTKKLSTFAVIICCFVTLVTAASAQTADLIETGVTVSGTPTSGSALLVTDTLTNQGTAATGTSYTQFFLSKDGTTKGTFLTYRYPAGLVAGVSATAASTSVMLPTNIAGTYFVMVCANGNKAVIESDYTNNCSHSAQFTVAGANLTETISVSPAGILLSGSTIQITDTLKNVGVAPASSSYTQLFLSTNGTTKGAFLGARYPSALAAGATATPAVTSVTVPTVGNYFVMVCANGNNAVPESNYSDNCASAPLNVLSAANTVVVDPAGIDSISCGLVAAPCKTIGAAINVATAGKTVLLKSGTYAEQVSITKSLTLVSAVKYGAIIQAPATPLVLDANGNANLVRIGGGSSAVLSGLTIQGPGPSGCGSIHYGIYVADANATITDNKILSIRDSSFSGCQNGVSIRFGSSALGYVGHTGTISNNIVLDYQKGGLVVDGLNTNVNVTGNTVTGQNAPGVNGQNGIQISRGAKGTVSNNTVANAAYFIACPTDVADPNLALCNVSGTQVGPKNSSAAGVLLYDVNGGVTLSGNTVSGNDIGIWISGDGPSTTNGSTNALVNGNMVTNNRAAGILVDVSSTGNKMYGNTAHSNGKNALGSITGFIDPSFAQGFGYDVVDENSNPLLNDWGYSGAPGAVPTTYDSNWGGGKGALLNY